MEHVRREVAYNVNTRPTVTMSAHTDVWDRAHRRMTIRADRVAFRGVVRFKRPQPCRYVNPSKARPSLVEWAHVATVARWSRRGLRRARRAGCLARAIHRDSPGDQDHQ